MAASIALGCGGKALVCRLQARKSRHRFVSVAAFLWGGQATDGGRSSARGTSAEPRVDPAHHRGSVEAHQKPGTARRERRATGQRARRA